MLNTISPIRFFAILVFVFLLITKALRVIRQYRRKRKLSFDITYYRKSINTGDPELDDVLYEELCEKIEEINTYNRDNGD